MFLWRKKDGGPESKVYAWGIEIKSLFSVLVLKFEKGSREAYHNHAFNSTSWLLKGQLIEKIKGYDFYSLESDSSLPIFYSHIPSISPIKTFKDTYHKVEGIENSNWVLTFRGPWSKTWKEYIPQENREITLTHGRKEI